MKPIGAAEQLMFTTVRLETKTGCGTGYFFTFDVEDGNVPVIVTNKHVVNYNPNEVVTFLLHLTEDGETANGNFTMTLATHWVFHPTQDLCYTYVAGVFDKVKSLSGKEVFYRPIPTEIIYGKEKLKSLSMIESVVMIGYPNGLWDHIHNFPIFRYGKTAAHPGYDFNEESVGLVDMACFPGSSGSPIFILDEGSFRDKRGNTTIGQNRLIFLGTLFAGPIVNAEGTIEVRDVPAIPTGKQFFSKTQMMMNLGYYVKAHELEAFRKNIENDLKKQK